MFTSDAYVVHAAQLADTDLDADELDSSQVISGSPMVSSKPIHESEHLAVGIWQHTAGTSRDVESDEVFIVLTGRATIEVADGPTLHVGPGDVGVLPAGAHTVWTIHETLRKVYVVAT